MKDYRGNHDVDRLKKVLETATKALPDQRAADASVTGNRRPAGDQRRSLNRSSQGTDSMRKRMLSGLLVAVVAATIVVGPHFLRTSPTTNADTDPTNGVASLQSDPTAAVDPFVDPCPQPSPAAPERPHRVGMLAVGAEAIRLCPGAVGSGDESVSAPADALVIDLDGFLGQIDAGAVAPPPTCPGQLDAAPVTDAPPFTIAVTYPNGRSVQLVGVDSLCSGVRVGTATVSSTWLVREFRERLRAQREALSDQPVG